MDRKKASDFPQEVLNLLLPKLKVWHSLAKSDFL